MRKFAPFAASFLSVALPVFASAADLRPLSDPRKIGSVFPPAARLRVLNIWATWCVPCVAEMPEMRTLDEAFGGEVAIVGVTLDDMIPNAKRETVAAFLDKQKIAYPNVYYTGNPDELGDAFSFSGEIPVTIVYDDKGKELWRTEGTIRSREMIARLRELSRRKQ
jgi:thiol-disulfide isomerase/thioredoxin